MWIKHISEKKTVRNRPSFNLQQLVAQANLFELLCVFFSIKSLLLRLIYLIELLLCQTDKKKLLKWVFQGRMIGECCIRCEEWNNNQVCCDKDVLPIPWSFTKALARTSSTHYGRQRKKDLTLVWAPSNNWYKGLCEGTVTFCCGPLKLCKIKPHVTEEAVRSWFRDVKQYAEDFLNVSSCLFSCTVNTVNFLVNRDSEILV